jgi:hypothetical protein
MKKYILIIGLLSIFCSCSNQGDRNKPKKERITYSVTEWTNSVELVVIDSCEYLFGAWGNATTLTHKGNCKNCRNYIK